MNGRAAARALVCLLAGTAACRHAPPDAAAERGRPDRPAAASPRKADTEGGCRLCEGDWGPHGLTGAVGCVCRARDAGRRCRGGDECEGDCLFAGEVDVAAPGPPRRGWFVGRCSERVVTYGCAARLPDRAAARGPQPLEPPPPEVCLD